MSENTPEVHPPRTVPPLKGLLQLCSSKNTFLYGRISISASTKSCTFVLLKLEKCPLDFHWMFIYNKCELDFFCLFFQTEGWVEIISVVNDGTEQMLLKELNLCWTWNIRLRKKAKSSPYFMPGGKHLLKYFAIVCQIW